MAKLGGKTGWRNWMERLGGETWLKDLLAKLDGKAGWKTKLRN